MNLKYIKISKGKFIKKYKSKEPSSKSLWKIFSIENIKDKNKFINNKLKWISKVMIVLTRRPKINIIIIVNFVHSET